MPREKTLLYVLEQANYPEQHLAQRYPDESSGRLVLTDDLSLRSYEQVSWQLGIPLPPPER